MSKPDDGGVAFPQAPPEPGAHWATDVGYGGMSLRDYFAAQALAGILQVPGLRPGSSQEMQRLAERVYEVADAMLAERAKEKP